MAPEVAKSLGEPGKEVGARPDEAPNPSVNNPGSKFKSSGTKITDFNMIKKLGEGTFGQVFLAVHKRTGNKHAIKMIEKRNLDARGLNSMFKE